MTARTITPPTWREAFTIRTRAEAEALTARLAARGYLAKADHTGACTTDPETGEHYHPWAVVVTLTPAQAERLAGGAR